MGQSDRSDSSIPHSQTFPSPANHGQPSFEEPVAHFPRISNHDGTVSPGTERQEWHCRVLPENLPPPTADSHGRRYNVSNANLNTAELTADQTRLTAGMDCSHTRSTEEVINVCLSRSNRGLEDRVADLDGYSAYCTDDNPALGAGRGMSLFRERSGGPWELRKPDEVGEEAQSRRSSESSWRSDDVPSWRRRRFDNIDWDVVDELRSFNFSLAPRGRRPTRPDFPPMSPRAIACKLWPERPDFSQPLEQDDILHVHAATNPDLNTTEVIPPPANDQDTHLLQESPRPRKWAFWKKG
ncbi:MAG: hypothetical protein Q9201_003693 [Fulgogasparrea decipioides]